MNSRFLRIIQHTISGLDLAALNLLILILHLVMNRVEASYSINYTFFWLWCNVSWLFTSWAGNLYHEDYVISFEVFGRRTVHIYLYWLVLVMIYLFFARQYQLSRVFIIFVLAGYGLALLVNRFIYTGLCYYSRHSPHLMHNVLILGFNDLSKKLMLHLEDSINTRIIGFCEKEQKVRELTHYPVLSSLEKAIEVSKSYKVSDIYSTISPEQDPAIYQLMQQADQECIHFRFIPDLTVYIKHPVHIEYLKEMPVLTLRQEPLDNEGNQIKKRVFDVAVSFLVIILVLSWMIPLIGLLIVLESWGPVFFVQQRTGKNNRSFGCIKFRSMKVNKEANVKQASRNDKRITKVGRFLRRSNLDELPQFINVLKGEMSIVGPRPHMLKHTDDYSKQINQYMVRQFLKPGITGWAQVNGFRGETKTLEQMQGRIQHDLWYLENWALWLDIRIMFMTIYKVFSGDENAF